MSWLRTYTVRGLSAVVAGPTRQLPRLPAPPPDQRHRPLVRLPSLIGAAPKVIARRVRLLTVVFAIDDSGSTHGPFGTDPKAARYVACHAVLDLMRRHGGQAGVIHWGDHAPDDLALAPVPVQRRRRLNRALGLRPQLGGTNPAVALARVRQLADVGPDETLAVLLLTDGLDLGAGLEQELAQLPPGAVHLVLVDSSGDCYGQEPAWRALPWGSFTRLGTFQDTDRLAWESGAVLAQAISLELPPFTQSPNK
jgi:hypothetical protein